MPNHIQNRLQIIGSKGQINEVLSFIAGESKDEDTNEPLKMKIDFNKIKPMPKELNIECNSNVEMWAEICVGKIDFSLLFTPAASSVSEMFKSGQYGSLASRMGAATAMEHLTGQRKGNVKDLSEEDFNAFVSYLRNYRTYGHTNWYEWAKDNWGTKWNAYSQNDQRDTEDTIYFQTAWNSPVLLIQELSNIFPLVSITLTYADEDSGSNAGVIKFTNGEPTDINQPSSQSKEAYDIYFDLHPDSKSDYQLVGNKYEYIDSEE